jgi:Rrf2 family iron-sulfur cluster assembly transcriptional regulator
MRLELTHRADYAVRAMIALAAPREPGLLSVRRIADAMVIPPRFLPQVMRDLAAAGLVEAQPGRRGGYRLARPADRITVLEVIEAAEGDTRRQTCVLRGGPCGHDGYCAVHPVFADAQEAVLGRLAEASLASVAVDYGAFDAPAPVKAGPARKGTRRPAKG